MTATRETFEEVFGAALRGTPCTVVGLHAAESPLPLAGWTALSSADRALLSRCRGATLDIGCGPGRMAAHLAELGHVALGIDLVPEAVAHARARGASALQRNVFGHVPAEGRWETVLLADGNIGIGGDPVALLRRAYDLLAPGGRVVCDLAEPGTGLRTRTAHLVCGDRRSPEFRWTLVGPESLAGLAGATAFAVLEQGRVGDRCFAVLGRCGA